MCSKTSKESYGKALKHTYNEKSVVPHAQNLITEGAEARVLRAWGQPLLHNELETNLSYLKLASKSTNKKNTEAKTVNS